MKISTNLPLPAKIWSSIMSVGLAICLDVYSKGVLLPISFFHVVFGEGDPSALQGNSTFCPSVTSALEGFSSQDGGTEKGWKRKGSFQYSQRESGLVVKALAHTVLENYHQKSPFNTGKMRHFWWLVNTVCSTRAKLKKSFHSAEEIWRRSQSLVMMQYMQTKHWSCIISYRVKQPEDTWKSR